MDIKHTPGPWTAMADRQYGFPAKPTPNVIIALSPILGADRNVTIAKVPRRGGAEALANARLIAAAPELLAVLSLMVEQICDPKNADHTLSAFAYGARISEARAVIAKANGQEARP